MGRNSIVLFTVLYLLLIMLRKKKQLLILQVSDFTQGNVVLLFILIEQSCIQPHYNLEKGLSHVLYTGGRLYMPLCKRMGHKEEELETCVPAGL